MLETPKAFCTYRTTYDIFLSYIFCRENQKDITMDNQQERFDLELAWLAGIIEGEGWISLTIVSSEKSNKSKLPAFTAVIGITNTDFQIIEKIESIFKKLDLKYRRYYRAAKIGSDGISRKEKIDLSVYARNHLKKLITSILPYVHGEKKNRIEKLLQFFQIRDSKPRSGRKSSYGIEEYEIYQQLYSYKGKSKSKILNDFTLRLESNEQDKV